jgi:hypothetical protein
MKMPIIMKTKRLCSFHFVALGLLAVGTAAHAATLTWTNTAGGDWSTAANWSPNQVPGSSDIAVITNAGSYTVSLNTSATVAGFLLGASSGVTTQAFSMTGQNLTLNGPGTVTARGVLNFNGGLSLYAPLTNSGTINLTNAGIYVVNYYAQGNQYGGGGLVNQPGGLIHWQGGGNISGEHGVYQSVPFDYFINRGIFTKTGGTNIIDCQVFDNTPGTITNLLGTLALGSYQTNLAGTYYAAADATIQFNALNDGTNIVSAGTPLVLAGNGQFQFLSGILYYPSNAIPNLALLGTTLKLGPAFQGGAITNLALDGIVLSNSLPVTGGFAAMNSPVLGNFTVASGGIFTGSNAATFGSVTVASGAQFIANGGSANTVGYPSFGGSLTVAHGAVMKLTGNFGMKAPFTNAGTVNISNAVVDVFYDPPDNLFAGLVNQSGGLMNLGNNVGIYNMTFNSNVGNSNGYFLNQGMIVQLPGTSTTNIISCPASAQVGVQQVSINLAFNFDNRQGTITNFSGTLALSGFRTNLAGTFYTAAGATTQLGGGTAATPLVPGTPLVLGGSGQYQFFSGYLYYSTNTIPNLSLQAGQLELGPGFQGGAVTNLTLDGIALTNQLSTTLPIHGLFTVLNSGNSGTLNYLRFGWDGYYGNGVYGNYIVAGGGVLNVVSNATMNGAVTVGNNGALNMDRASMFGAVTVANGGLITVTNGGGTINPSSSLTVAAGGTINITQSGLAVNGPLTNAGTININNPIAAGFGSGLRCINDGVTYKGGVINQGAGLINLASDSTFLNTGGDFIGGHEYIVNQGTIIKSAGTNVCNVSAPFVTNSGAITVRSGFISMRPLTLQPGGSLNVGLNSATSYGSFIVTAGSGLTGTQALTGTFNATLNNGYVPASGATFNVLAYGNYTGAFSSLGLPAAVNWQSNYGSTNFSLVAGKSNPQFGTFNLSGTNLILSGVGGSPGSNCVIRASTNLALPVANWSPVSTNTFDGSGQFHYTNHVSPISPRQFFIFKLP